jgi:rSAM/selenodomain-associated transferase 1
MHTEALIIFVRKPEQGKVKTRLAASVGEDEALRIYQLLLEHTKAVANQLDCDKYVFYASAIEPDDMWSNGFTKRLQAESDLGARMKSAFADLFQLGYQRICIIGSDCFELTPLIVQQAFAGLNEADIVIGPAKDGGYYLLGMRHGIKEVFEGVQWSTENVFAQTMELAAKVGWTCSLLPRLVDVDTVEDLPESFSLERGRGNAG